MRADVIKFELSPRGNSNSLKFAHEQLLNQFFIDQGGNWTYRHRLLLAASLWNYRQQYNHP